MKWRCREFRGAARLVYDEEVGASVLSLPGRLMTSAAWNPSDVSVRR